MSFDTRVKEFQFGVRITQYKQSMGQTEKVAKVLKPDEINQSGLASVKVSYLETKVARLNPIKCAEDVFE